MKISTLKTIFYLMVVCLLPMSCQATDDVYVTWNENHVIVNPRYVDGMTVKDDGGHLKIELDSTANDDIAFHLSGKSMDGSLIYKGSHARKFYFDGLTLLNDSGYAIKLNNKKHNTLVIADGTENRVGDAGINSKGNLTIKGKGSLTIEAKNDGHKGIHCNMDLEIEDDVVLNVTTSGQPLKMEEMKAPQDMGGMPGPPQGASPRTLPHREGDLDSMPGPPQGNFNGMPGPPPGMQGGMPGPPPGMDRRMQESQQGDSTNHSLPFGGGPGRGVRYNYEGATKAIKVLGDIIISGGKITIKTQTPGAEGLEAKKTLTINGGDIHIDAHNDAVSVGKQMTVTGGNLYSRSTNNDAIDINAMQQMMPMGMQGGPMGMLGGQHKDMEEHKPERKSKNDKEIKEAYIQTGGSVEAVCEAGPPEEALDTDNMPIKHTGGTLKLSPERHEGFPPPMGGMPGDMPRR